MKFTKEQENIIIQQSWEYIQEHHRNDGPELQTIIVKAYLAGCIKTITLSK